MELRKDFAEVEIYFERLLSFSNQFKKFDEQWVHLKHKEDFKEIYELPRENYLVLDRIYTQRRQFGHNMRYLLSSFNDVVKYPSLYSYVKQLEDWLADFDNIYSVITKVENEVDKLEYCPWAIGAMIDNHKEQMQVFQSLRPLVNILKQSNLYRKEEQAYNQVNSLYDMTQENMDDKQKDIFLCHASEDKELIVEPLKNELERNQISCWYDKAQIKWEDSIIRKVNNGLKESRYVIIVLSINFLSKHWPQHELEAALNIEASDGEVKVLPLMVGTNEDIKAISSEYPILVGKRYMKWNDGLNQIVSSLKERLE